MSSIDFNEIRRRVSVLRALRALAWQVRGLWWPNHRGPCPVCRADHRKRQPFWCTSERWYCHACHQGGDVLDLWRLVHKLDLFNAARDLCRVAGEVIPYRPRGRQRHRLPENREEDR